MTFKNTYFGKPYRTNKGEMLLFLQRREDEKYVNIYFAGFDEEEGSFYIAIRDEFGKDNDTTDRSGDIASEWQTNEDVEQLRDELDALHMRYLSQVSLWKSRHKELKKKISEPIDEDKLNRLAYILFPKLSVPISGEGIVDTNEDYREALKVGYRKAWEDKQ